MLLFGPCLLNMLTHFVASCLGSIKLQMLAQTLPHPTISHATLQRTYSPNPYQSPLQAIARDFRIPPAESTGAAPLPW